MEAALCGKVDRRRPGALFGVVVTALVPKGKKDPAPQLMISRWQRYEITLWRYQVSKASSQYRLILGGFFICSKNSNSRS